VQKYGHIEHYETQLRKIKSIIAESKSRVPDQSLKRLEETQSHLKSLKFIAQLNYFDYVTNEAVGTGSKFQCNVESPIDWTRSKMVSQKRGFDTLNFNSTYVFSDEKGQKIDDMVDQLSGGASFGSFFASLNVAGNISKRVSTVSSSGKSEGTLIIGSFATTRYVRAFESLHFDTEKLRGLKMHLLIEKNQQMKRVHDRKTKAKERKERVCKVLKDIQGEKMTKKEK